MRKLVVSEFITLDGVMEDPGGAEKTPYGGWTRPYWDEAIAKFKFDELLAADALLLGRVTYEGFAKAWPSQKDEAGFADRMNGLPKYVASTSLQETSWNNSQVITGDVAGTITRLKQQPGKDILVAGSRTLLSSLLKENLVDEFRLLVYPVVLGCGKRLFEEAPQVKLRLVESHPTGSGVMALVYQTVRE